MNVFFLSVGALLYAFAGANNIDVKSLGTPDHLFPEIALNHLGIFPAIIFMLGLTAATFATTDSALTALTTSFCVDFLNFSKKENQADAKLVRTRHGVHIGFSFVMLLVVIGFKIINDDSVVNAIFKAAGYTYGPLLGLFAFGMITKMQIKDKLVPYICVASPILSFIIDKNSLSWFGYTIGFELIVVNALITYLLLLISAKLVNQQDHQTAAVASEKVEVQ
ncbi:sodium/panthothenate symporter [compost metagenome]